MCWMYCRTGNISWTLTMIWNCEPCMLGIVRFDEIHVVADIVNCLLNRDKVTSNGSGCLILNCNFVEKFQWEVFGKQIVGGHVLRVTLCLWKIFTKLLSFAWKMQNLFRNVNVENLITFEKCLMNQKMISHKCIQKCCVGCSIWNYICWVVT